MSLICAIIIFLEEKKKKNSNSSQYEQMQNTHGNTPLHFALAGEGGGGFIAEYLIQKGADDSIRNLRGLTAYDRIA